MSACVNGASSNTSPTSSSLVDKTSCDYPCEQRRLARGEWAVVLLLLVGWELARVAPSLGGRFFHLLVLVVEVLVVADSCLLGVFEVLVRLAAVFLPRVPFVLGILLKRQNCTVVNQSRYSSYLKHVLPIMHA